MEGLLFNLAKCGRLTTILVLLRSLATCSCQALVVLLAWARLAWAPLEWVLH